MKVWWIQQTDGSKYCTSRMFTMDGAPKLYKTREYAQRIIDGSDGFSRSRMKGARVVGGELHETDTAD